MRSFTTYDAQNRLSGLLDAVASGETIEIVRRGKPVAHLVPIPKENGRFASPSDAASWLRRNRVNVPAGTLRVLLDEGRR